MMKPVGYLVKRKDGLYDGQRGSFYDYLLCGNGVFVEAEGPLLAARVPVAEAEIRGLEATEPKVVLRHGLIPGYFFDLALDAMLGSPEREFYIAVIWEDGFYRLRVPEQERHGAGVKYERLDHTVLDLHSHGSMRAFFSLTDDRDEGGLRLYAVVGKLRERPQVRLRVGVYGYHMEIPWSQVFRGDLKRTCGISRGVEDCFELDEVQLDELETAKLLEEDHV